MEQQLRTLDMLEEGGTAYVHALQLQGAMRGRMQDIGLIAGTQVQCVRKSPSGNPAAYRIRGAIIVLRMEDAAGVIIVG
jgi:ferrous iron transport protein A